MGQVAHCGLGRVLYILTESVRQSKHWRSIGSSWPRPLCGSLLPHSSPLFACCPPDLASTLRSAQQMLGVGWGGNMHRVFSL